MKGCAVSEDMASSEQAHVMAQLPKLYIWSDSDGQWLGISQTRKYLPTQYLRTVNL